MVPKHLKCLKGKMAPSPIEKVFLEVGLKGLWACQVKMYLGSEWCLNKRPTRSLCT